MKEELEHLIHQCLQKERKAQSSLYSYCFDTLMSIGVRYKKNREDARSLVNEGFFRVLMNLDKYDMQRPFIPWIKTIMIRVVIDDFRKNKAYREAFYEEADHPEPGVDNAVIRKMAVEEVEAVLHRLPESEKTVFNLYVMEGYPHKEIAEKLGCSERSSKRHLASAKRLLAEIIKKKFQLKKVI